ncbi:uncharacterized protein ACIQIH_003045 isoform 1-T1 [Cyanocitta cristata]
MPIPEGYGTFAWRGDSHSLPLPPVKPHRGGATERLQRLPHTQRGELRWLVPNFEASPHEGFPRHSRETPTSSAALAAPHHRYGARPRGPLSPRCLCLSGARRGGGRAGYALRGGRGIPAAAPAVPGNKATGGGGGGGGSHKRAQPQEPAGPRADGSPRREPGLRPAAHPPWHLPTQAVRAILNTHRRARAHGSEVSAARDNRQRPSPRCAGGAAAAVGEGHTHASTHTHAPRARQKCAFQACTPGSHLISSTEDVSSTKGSAHARRSCQQPPAHPSCNTDPALLLPLPSTRLWFLSSQGA